VDITIQKKLDSFFKEFNRKKYKKGEILINAGEPPLGIFFLKEGMVKQYAISNKGDELILNIFKENSFFPMSWAINDSPNEYYFEAVTNAVIYLAPKDEVIKFIKSNSDVIYNLLSRVYKGTDGLLLRMVHLMASSAYTRLVTELLIQSKRFGKKRLDGQIELRISEKELAAESGMTRETISRELKLLKDKNLVTLDTKLIIINNLQKLNEQLLN
jgi:CRP/FNR family transcriptional regulator, cyclic AMP receptor protein